MTINRLLLHGKPKPDEVARLNKAYSYALRSLSLVDRNDPFTEMIARKVIEIGATGVTDPAKISQLAIKHFQA